MTDQSGLDIFGQYLEHFRHSRNVESSRIFAVEDSQLGENADLAEIRSAAQLFSVQHPADPFGPFWLGVLAYRAREFSVALGHLIKALEMGFPGMRILWYAAQAACSAGEPNLGPLLLQKLIELRPDFHPAKVILNSSALYGICLVSEGVADGAFLREVQFSSMECSGTYKTWNLLLELGICTYFGRFHDMFRFHAGSFRLLEQHHEWLTSCLPIVVRQGGRRDFSFEVDVGAQFSHSLSPAIFSGKKHVRIVRDPRDVCISKQNNLQSNTTEICVDDVLDLPTNGGEGIFGQATIEEWLLVETFLEVCVPTDNLMHLYFEDLTDPDRALRAVRGLVSFLEIERGDEAIQSAVSNSERAKATAYPNSAATSGRAERWRSANSQSVLNRYALVASVVRTEHQARYDLSIAPVIPAFTWDLSVFTVARDLWIESMLSSIRRNFQQPQFQFGEFEKVLQKYCMLVDELPILECHLALQLLLHRTHEAYAIDRLRRVAQSRSRIARYAAGGLLLRVAPDSAEGHEAVSDFHAVVQGSKSRQGSERIAGYYDRLGIDAVLKAL